MAKKVAVKEQEKEKELERKEKTIVFSFPGSLIDELAGKLGMGKTKAEKKLREAMIKLMQDVLPTYNLAAAEETKAVAFLEDGTEHEILKVIEGGSVFDLR